MKKKFKLRVKDLKITRVATAIIQTQKLLLFSFLFFIGNSLNVVAQMNKWVMPRFEFDMTAAPAVAGPLYPGAPPSGNYNVSNGAYGQTGALVFFIRDMNVLDQNGIFITSLGGAFGTVGGEITIVPVPGKCLFYYVFFSVGVEVKYNIIDCSSGTPVVDRGNGFGVGGPATGYFLFGSSFATPIVGTGLAASKRVSGSTGIEYNLYMVNSGKVYHSNISSTGISTPSLIHSSNYISYGCTGSPSTEVELSENGQYLAFNGINSCNPWASGNVEVIQLPTPGSANLLSVYSSPSTKIYGLELVGSGIPDLYVAGERNYFPAIKSIFDKFNIISSAVVVLNLPPTLTWPYTAPYGVTKSFLELSKSGNICYVCDYMGNRYFVEYNIGAATFSPIQIDAASLNVTPYGSAGGMLQTHYDGVYVLPDQNDGENYNSFTGIQSTGFTGLALAPGGNLNTDVDAPCNFSNAYNCQPINLTALFNTENVRACGSTMDIHQVADDCTPLRGTGYFNCTNCSGEFIASDNPWTKDIRGYSSDGLSLKTHTGYFLVKWNITDCCGNTVSKTAKIRILGALVSTNLEIFDRTMPQPNPINPYLPASTNIASPVSVGAASFGWKVANSTGNATGYTTLIEEVDGISGLPTGAGTLYNKTIAVGNVNSIGAQNPNLYCIPTTLWPPLPTPLPTFGLCASGTEYINYWNFNSGYNSYMKYYKLTVTLFNPCSSSSQYSYVYVGFQGARSAMPTGIAENSENKVMRVFPNPANNELFISLPTNSASEFKVELKDLMGRSILTYEGKSEKNTHALDISQLASGVYIWNCESGSITARGKVEIVR